MKATKRNKAVPMFFSILENALLVSVVSCSQDPGGAFFGICNDTTSKVKSATLEFGDTGKTLEFGDLSPGGALGTLYKTKRVDLAREVDSVTLVYVDEGGQTIRHKHDVVIQPGWQGELVAKLEVDGVAWEGEIRPPKR